MKPGQSTKFFGVKPRRRHVACVRDRVTSFRFLELIPDFSPPRTDNNIYDKWTYANLAVARRTVKVLSSIFMPLSVAQAMSTTDGSCTVGNCKATSRQKE